MRCGRLRRSLGFGAHAAEPYYELPAEYPVCSDDSYQRAVDSGVKLGVAAAMPWSGIDPASGKAIGVDVELHAEVLKHMGITKITYEAGAFNSLNFNALEAYQHGCHRPSRDPGTHEDDRL